MENLITKQLEKERDLFKTTADNRKSKIRQQIKKGAEYNNNYGNKAVAEMLPHVEDFIKGLYELRNQHTRRFYWNHVKPRHEAGEKPECDLAEMVAMTLTGTLSKDMTFTEVSAKMARRAFYMYNIKHTDYEDNELHAIQFFGSIIRYVAEHTDIFVMESVDGREYRIFLTPEWEEQILKEQENDSQDVDSYTPMIVPPLPHKNLLSGKGGYLEATSPLLKYPVKEGGKVHPLLKAFNDKTNPDFFEFINRVQGTAYRINTKMLEVLSQYYSEGYFFEDFPVDVDKELVKTRANKDIKERNEKRKKWAEVKGTEYIPLTDGTMRKIRKEHENKELHKTNKTIAVLEQAEEHAKYEAIYFPVFLDSRGRMYPYANGCLSYQGDKLAKSLLVFAKGQKLNKDGVDNLFESLGNMLKLDKKTIDFKTEYAIRWFGEHMDTFTSGDFSIFFEEEEVFDEPITALAIVLELVEFMKDPDYECPYIAHRDARVSGSSIIGTALRDKGIMELTSVLDWYDEEDSLADAYTAVAYAAYDIATEDTESNPMCRDLLLFAEDLFTRKAFKHLVMCYVSYGLTDHSLREYTSSLIDWEEALSHRHKYLFDEIVFKALKASMPSCFSYLNTMRKAAREVADRDGKIAYTNPLSSFPVVFSTKQKLVRPVKVKSPYQTISINLTTRINKPDVNKIVLASSPNVIHSCDAGLLYLTSKHIPGDLCFIHDSMSTNINDVKQAVRAYANAMYEVATTDPLNNILEQLKVEHRITLINTASDDDIETIRSSRHIIC